MAYARASASTTRSASTPAGTAESRAPGASTTTTRAPCGGSDAARAPRVRMRGAALSPSSHASRSAGYDGSTGT